MVDEDTAVVVGLEGGKLPSRGEPTSGRETPPGNREEIEAAETCDWDRCTSNISIWRVTHRAQQSTQGKDEDTAHLWFLCDAIEPVLGGALLQCVVLCRTK